MQLPACMATSMTGWRLMSQLRATSGGLSSVVSLSTLLKNAITKEVPKVARDRKKPTKHGRKAVAKKKAVASLHSTPVKKCAVEVDTPVKYDSKKNLACRCRGAAKREAKRLGLSDDAATTMWTAAYREGAKMFDDYIAAGGIPVPV